MSASATRVATRRWRNSRASDSEESRARFSRATRRQVPILSSESRSTKPEAMIEIACYSNHFAKPCLRRSRSRGELAGARGGQLARAAPPALCCQRRSRADQLRTPVSHLSTGSVLSGKRASPKNALRTRKVPVTLREVLNLPSI